MQTVGGGGGVRVAADGHIATPRGFRADAVACGLKKNGKRDLGVLLCDRVGVGAAVYTTNIVQAAPLRVTRETINKSGGQLQAIIVNSGNANACTGVQGEDDARAMQQLCAQQWGIAPEHVAVASTGVIGVPMPMERVQDGCHALSVAFVRSDADIGARHFAEAIMTTDTREKSYCVCIDIDGVEVTIAGVAKGSGMIHPNMATMLAFMTTDVPIAQSDLHALLVDVTEHTFNMITVDGDTSTNDMVLVVSSNCAPIVALTPAHRSWDAFAHAFRIVATHLAQEIARDGEGATKRIAVHVSRAQDDVSARIIAKTIAGSSLVKSAMFGADANWGRILAAAGRAGVSFDPEVVTIALGDAVVFREGTPQVMDEEALQTYLQQEYIDVVVVLGTSGSGCATAWGCDLTYDYVRINASYRS